MNILRYLPYFLYVSLLFIILILGVFPFTILLMLLPNKIRDWGMFWLLKGISNLWFILIGIIPINYHRKKIKFDKSYIIIPNHQSYLDAATIYTCVPKLFKSLGKSEITRAPIYGIIYKAVVITVDRSSMAARANSFRRMKSELTNGNSILIFPEGTFGKEPNEELMPFQNGAFTLALLQETTLMPILFLDTAERLHPSKLYRFQPGLNRCVFLPPIEVIHLNKNESDYIKDYTQTYMQSCLDYCRNNHPKEVWDYALNWQKNNPLPS